MRAADGVEEPRLRAVAGPAPLPEFPNECQPLPRLGLLPELRPGEGAIFGLFPAMPFERFVAAERPPAYELPYER
jgi:hypothetical protein